MADDQTQAEINRSYWGSDDSVNDIAERLGVSRRALYDSIAPRPAGAACPACGGAMVFRNRTALERREATCAECGHEESLEAGTAPAGRAASSGRPAPEEPSAADAGVAEPEVEQLERGARLSPMPPRSVPGSGSGPVLGGALLVGLAAGAAVGYLLKRG